MNQPTLETRGDRLKYLRTEHFKFYSAAAFAKFLGVDRGHYLMAEKNTAWIKKGLTKLEAEGVNIEWLEHGYGNMLKGEVKEEAITEYGKGSVKKSVEQEVPLYDFMATAGLVEVFAGTERIIDYIKVPNVQKCDGAIQITGDSMYPLLKAGDIVMYKQVHDITNGIFFGEMYLVAVQSDGDFMTTVKFIHPSDRKDSNKHEYVKLVSHNVNHAEKEIHLDSIKALALIKASIRKHTMA